MKVIVMTEYILRGDNQVEPDSEIIRDILLHGYLLVMVFFGPLKSVLCSKV